LATSRRARESIHGAAEAGIHLSTYLRSRGFGRGAE
jgi:hypothetical protein